MVKVIRDKDPDKKPDKKPDRNVVSIYEHGALDELLAEDPSALDPKAILAQAREEAERKVQEAYTEGMRRGMAAGEEKFKESVGESVQSLNRAADSIEQVRQEFLDAIEPQLVQLAASIAAKIINREASVSSDLIKRTARSVLEKIVNQEQVTLRLNPRDLEILRVYEVALLEDFPGIKQLDLVADQEISHGGCIAVTENLKVDGRLESQLEKIINELME